MGWLFLRGGAAWEEQVSGTAQEFSFGQGGLGCLLGLQVEVSDGQLVVCAWKWE